MIRAGWEEGVAIIRKDKESLYSPPPPPLPPPPPPPLCNIPSLLPPRSCQILTPHHSGGGRDSHLFIAISPAREGRASLAILPDHHGHIVKTS